MAGRQARIRHGFAKHKWLKSIDSKLKFPTVPQSTHTEGRHVNVHKLSKCVCRQWLWLIPVHCRRPRRQQNFWFTFTSSSLWTLPFMLELAQVLQQQQQQQPRQQNSANHQIIIIIIWIALLHWLLLLLVKLLLLLLQWTCQHWIEHITDWLPFSLFAFFRQCKTRSPSVWISVRVGTLNRTLRDLCSSIWTLWTAAAAAAFFSPSLTTLSCYWAIIQILVTFIIYFCTLPFSASLASFHLITTAATAVIVIVMVIISSAHWSANLGFDSIYYILHCCC